MTQEKSLQNNIWKYTLILIANKRIFVAIWGAYYLTIPGVTPKIIGLILLAGNISSCIFEIPSGFMADKMGHKFALVTARVLVWVSTLLFLVANDIPFLVLGAIFFSAGVAFQSGAGSAFMHETLTALKREHDYAKVMGKASSLGFAIPIIFTVTLPFLVSISFKLPFLIALVIDTIGFLAAFSLTVPPVPQKQIEEIGVTNFRQVMREGYRLRFFSVALFSSMISGALFSISSFRAPYQSFLEIPVIWFGVFFGIGRALASLMLAYSGKIKHIFTMPSFFGFQLILYTFLFVILGMVSTWWVVVLVFLIINAFQWGLGSIDGAFQLEIIKTSKFKATLLSAAAQIDQMVAGISGVCIGFLIERVSYQYGFLYSGVVFFIVLIPLYVYIVRRWRSGMYNIQK